MYLSHIPGCRLAIPKLVVIHSLALCVCGAFPLPFAHLKMNHRKEPTVMCCVAVFVVLIVFRTSVLSPHTPPSRRPSSTKPTNLMKMTTMPETNNDVNDKMIIIIMKIYNNGLKLKKSGFIWNNNEYINLYIYIQSSPYIFKLVGPAGDLSCWENSVKYCSIHGNFEIVNKSRHSIPIWGAERSHT